MKCEQKSGLFLNLNCNNTAEETCNNCQKKVCSVHAFKTNTKIYCEDCYWENYLYTAEIVNTTKRHDDVFISTNHTPTTFSNTNSESQNPEGFENGFGGGSFGGGGAQAEWTDGEMQSLHNDDENNNIGGMLSADDTFFYS